ncbi:MAG: class I SAM-dependent methyltransferase [Oligoflexia bacterium]|nr:class I SAM-dependent methyltransferase [Oligoflexia bacterium]
MELLAKSQAVQIEFLVADLTKVELDENSYDAIISIWCHLPSQERKILHQKCVEALTDQGLFILEAYTPKQLDYKTGGPPDINLLVSLNDLIKELHPLNILHAQEIVRHIEEGQGHVGQSAVVQFIAKKQGKSNDAKTYC